MKKISGWIVKARYVLLAVFVALVGLSAFLMTRVNINYNMLIYLDEDSTSTVALNTMEREFGSVGQAQVMVTNVDFKAVEGLKNKLEEVSCVASVVTAQSSSDAEYFKKNSETTEIGTALYKIFLKTGNYDVASYDAIDEIRTSFKNAVDDGYVMVGSTQVSLNDGSVKSRVMMNGGAVSSKFLTEQLNSDMTKILVIAVVVVLVILTIVSTSWVEPVIFLFVAGGAILINMGTNILLNYLPNIGNSMSFITKAIAAVMQLALAMDYSIILLHAYKAEKEAGLNKIDAIKAALAKSFAPVSASSITTIAGLVALMFMSFSIGFDVGLVLAKGILISLLCVFLFMPALLVLADPLLEKTKHKTIGEVFSSINEKAKEKAASKGKKRFTFADFQFKTRYIIPIVGVLLVIAGAAFNFNSEYDFVLQASTDNNAVVNVEDKEISKEFGTQNTLVVLLDKNTYTYQEEMELISYMQDYKYKDKNVINSAQGLTTYGLNIPLSKEVVSAKFGLSESIVGTVYDSMGVEYQTLSNLIKYMVTNDVANVYLNGVENTLDNAYDSYKDSLYLENGSVNTVAVAGMKAFVDGYKVAYENNLLDAETKAKYESYKTLITVLDYNHISSAMPFYTEEYVGYVTANSQSGVEGAAYYFEYVTFASKNKMATAYGEAITNKLAPYYAQVLSAEDNFYSDNYVRVIFNLDMPASGEDSFKAINEITDHVYDTYGDCHVVCETFVYSQIKDVFNDDIVKVNLISFFAVLLIIALTFKSAFVPVLLTVLIQGAIWITMGISTISGNNIFFICYLVVMCIQMGATIDYGILLTNNYINYRKTMNKTAAMAEALKSSAITIFTSGSILILATLIVGLVSKVAIISDLGLLLTRGCIISVFMIIFCLPQFLILTDKIIEKTSYKTKFYNEK